jgi:hypothetical protein
MGLKYSGEQASDLSNVSLEAFDASTGKRVVVKVSTEAYDDYGLEKAMEAGERKYDLGQLEPNGTVRVTTTDIDA